MFITRQIRNERTLEHEAMLTSRSKAENENKYFFFNFEFRRRFSSCRNSSNYYFLLKTNNGYLIIPVECINL